MQSLSPSQALGIAVPRRPAVLCIKGPDGSTDMILTTWFNWLTFKSHPMVAYSMDRSASLGLNLASGDELFLAFPPVKEALQYQAGFRTAYTDQQKPLPQGIEPVSAEGVPVLIPARSEVLLRCTLQNAYNYPFRKVRIFNCVVNDCFAPCELSDDSDETQK